MRYYLRCKAPESDKVLAKLSNLFNKNRTNWIEVDLSPWGSDDKGISQFKLIKDAILSHRMIEFNYFGSSGEKTIRRVEPMKLIFKINAWYLQAFCLTRNAIRMFKIVRMSDVQMTQEVFIEKMLESLPSGSQTLNDPKWIEICLKICADGVYRVYDEFEEKDITKNKDGSFTIITRLPENEWLIRYLLSFGADAEVVSPQHIRDTIENELNKIILKYRETT